MDKEIRTFFESEVKLFRPINGGAITTLGTIPKQLTQAFERLAATVDQYWWVPSAEYNLHLVGSVDTPETVLQIDAVCKMLGYESRTQIAFHGEQTTKVLEETIPVVRQLQTATAQPASVTR